MSPSETVVLLKGAVLLVVLLATHLPVNMCIGTRSPAKFMSLYGCSFFTRMILAVLALNFMEKSSVIAVVAMVMLFEIVMLVTRRDKELSIVKGASV